MGQLKCKKVKLWHCVPCRLTLVCISSKNSTNHEECWLILTGLPSLLLDPISCWLVSSAVRCRLQLPPSIARCQLPSLWPTPTCIPLPTSGHVEDRGLRPLFGFTPKQTKGLSAWRSTYIVSHICISVFEMFQFRKNKKKSYMKLSLVTKSVAIAYSSISP